MSRNKTYPKIILWGGLLVFGWGLQGAIFDSLSSGRHSYSSDFGVVLGFGSHMIIGVFAMLIANSLIKIDKRLDQIESIQASSEKAPK